MKTTKWLVLLASVLLIVMGMVIGTVAIITDTITVSYLSGDVNGDGVVNNKDLTRLKKYLSGQDDVDLTPIQIQVNTDAVFTMIPVDGGYAISEYIGNHPSVVVPVTYRGESVIAIKAGAFANATKLTSVTFELTVGWTAGDTVIDVTDATSVATYLTDTYADVDWEHGHVFGRWNVVSEPTCDDNGYSESTCGCGAVEIDPIPATGHAFGSWITVEEPTCTSEGLEQRVCSACNKTERKTLPATGHTVANDGMCSVCGTFVYTQGLTFALNADGTTYSVTGYQGNYTRVVVPATYRGLPVTGIGQRAFRLSVVESIDLPEGILFIGVDAFSRSSLTYIDIPSSVTDIGSCAFMLSSLTGVTFGENSNLTNIAYSAFRETLIESIELPQKLQSIKAEVFYGCANLTSVTIPDSVTSIDDKAFYECSSLTNIKLSDNVISIGEYALAYCSNLKSVTIPDSVTSIGYGAFHGCSGIESIVIPDSVQTVGEWAFANCTGLVSVTIGSGVTSIGKYAFYGCDGLTSAIFKVTDGWLYSSGSSSAAGTPFFASELSDPARAAVYLRFTCNGYVWTRS